MIMKKDGQAHNESKFGIKRNLNSKYTMFLSIVFNPADHYAISQSKDILTFHIDLDYIII